ncbi:MAG TPA: T9SS type A sorting domain-containing protein [Flavobacteriales bacterium]|nr:T9SS type A sorting domain-containing protein [Flavobacteriales bacterium]HIA11750.1 T9SS type A sorting domain-containing protein [Flavobacteriales bacterium]
MKNRNTLFGISFIGISMLLYLITPTVINEDSTYSPRVKHANESYAKNVQGIAGAMDYYAERRINVATGKMDLEAMLQADENIRNFGKAQKTAALGLDWNEMGPDNVGGRTRCILIDNQNPARVYAGSVSGGLWISNTYGYSWSAYDDDGQNLAVASIAQTTNGDIYFGTGEGFAYAGGQGTLGTPAMIGRGVFKSTDGGLTFRQLPSTLPTDLNDNTIAWAFVNRLAADPIDPLKIWAATNNGLLFSVDSGATWTPAIWANPPTNTIPIQAKFEDVKVNSDGTVGAGSSGTAWFRPAGQADFTSINSKLTGISGASRVEFAFAPSDPNYIYICATSGGLHNLYQSKNGGTSFSIIVPGDPSVEDPVFSDQGYYDLLLGVFPDNKEHILVGGVALYSWNGPDNTWGPAALTGGGGFGSGLSVHADKHTVVFSPNYSSTPYYYVGSDGGVAVHNIDGESKFYPFNTGYSVTQIYAMGTSREGWVAGGTQDNGNPFIDFTGNTPKSQVYNLPSGDGGYMQFSVINPAAFFWESQGGDANRSPDHGSGAGGFFVGPGVMCDGDCDDVPGGTGGNDGVWVTPLVIWESFNDTASKEMVEFIATKPYSAGATIYIPSNNNGFPFEYLTQVPVSVNDTLNVKDLVQSKFFVALYSGIWMCKNVLDFSDLPEWYKLSETDGANCLEVSRDGDVIFIGASGNLIRISGINGIMPGDQSTKNTSSPGVVSAVTETTIYNGSQALAGVGLDPNNANNVVIALGNYGNNVNVKRSTNALGAGSFSSIQGDLPNMPVYDALIEKHDSNKIILATEYGIYASDNGMDASPTWTEENTGMARVPSFMLIQQLHKNDNCTGVTNEGVIYVATHGRGFFKETMYADSQATDVCTLPVGIEDPIADAPAIEMEFYPNPVINGSGNLSFTMKTSEVVILKIYNISGKLVDAVALGKKVAGDHTVNVSMNELGAGTYFVQLSSSAGSATTKVMLVE